MARRRRRLPSAFRQSEVDKLLATAERLRAEAKTAKRQHLAHRNQLIIQTGLLMGLRVSEMCKLNVQDIDFDAGQSLILEAKGGRDRTVPIPDKLLLPLLEWVGARTEGPVFPNARNQRLSTRTVQLMCEKIGKLAGLSKKLKPHSLRHTYATTLLNRGATIREVQELLGHSSVAVSEIYCSVQPEHLKGAVERL